MGFIFMKPKVRCHKVRKSAESQAALDRLNSFLEGALDEPVRFLVRFWGDQRTVITYAELRRIITDEDVPQDIMDDWFHDYSTLLSERITPMWRDAMITGYRSNPAFEGTGFQFNSSEENVRCWMADRSAELVTNCCREQQKAIRYLVAESISHQMAPAELARYIRPTIGLTERQAAANLKYYENMKSQLSENHPRMKPESIENRAREAAARYAERQQRYRAETIARTELATAYHQGNDEAVRQAMAQNLMPPMKKVWSTSGDDKVCPACSALEGMEIGMDDGFQFTSGRRTMEVELPPAHPRCACAVMYVEEKQQETSEAENTGNVESYQEEQPNFYDNSDSGMAAISDEIEWPPKGTKLNREEYKELMEYSREKGVELSGFKHFDGDIQTVKELLDDAASVSKLYPDILMGKKRLTIALDDTMNSTDFAITRGHIISINANAFRDTKRLTEEYDKLMRSGWFVTGTDYHSIIKHEIGHVVSNLYGIDGLKVAMKITGLGPKETMQYIKEHLSEYAGEFKDGSEIISEVFSNVFGNGKTFEFSLRFIEECVNMK